MLPRLVQKKASACKQEGSRQYTKAASFYIWLLRTYKVFNWGDMVSLRALAVFLEFSRVVTNTAALWKQLQQVHQGKAYTELEELRDTLCRELEDVRKEVIKRGTADTDIFDKAILQLRVLSSMMSRLGDWEEFATENSSSTSVEFERKKAEAEPKAKKAEDELIQWGTLGFSQLHAAVVNESADSWKYTELQIASRSNASGQGQLDIFDRTPLHYISTRTKLKHLDQKDVTMLKRVLYNTGFPRPEEGYLNMKDLVGLTPFHYAVWLNNVHAMKALVDLKCDINVQGIDGMSALHFAAATGFKDSTRTILEELGDSVDDIVDNYHRTALHWAVISGATDVAAELLDKGASITVKDKYRRTPVHLTLFTRPKRGDKSCQLLQLFRDKRPTEFMQAIKAQDDDGCTVLHLGAKAGRLPIIEQVIDSKTSAEREQLAQPPEAPGPAGGPKAKPGKAPGVVNIRDNRGRTALSFAAEGGYKDVVQYLLNSGAGVGPKDRSKRSPLYWALVNGEQDVMQLLMKDIRSRKIEVKRQFVKTMNRSAHESADIDGNWRNDKGQSPLSWAAGNGHEEAVLLLLDEQDASGRGEPTGTATPLAPTLGSALREAPREPGFITSENPKTPPAPAATPHRQVITSPSTAHYMKAQEAATYNPGNPGRNSTTRYG